MALGPVRNSIQLDRGIEELEAMSNFFEMTKKGHKLDKQLNKPKRKLLYFVVITVHASCTIRVFIICYNITIYLLNL